MTWAVLSIAVVSCAAVGWLIWRLLLRVTAWGGERLDGVEAGRRAMTETNAYRGRPDPDDIPLDGGRRLTRPGDDAGFGLFG